jgi:hypothetical protein
MGPNQASTVGPNQLVILKPQLLGSLCGSGGNEVVREPGRLAGWVVEIERHTAKVPTCVEPAGVPATSTVAIPIDGENKRISGQFAATVRLPATHDPPRTVQVSVGSLDDVEYDLETIALCNGPLAIYVTRHVSS